MGKSNEGKKRDKELFAKEVQEETANKVWKYNRNLLETSLDPLVTIGTDGIITDVNSATEKATGLPREKINGTDFSEYFTEPDKARAGYKQVFDVGKVVDYELYLKHINGSSIPVLYNASVYKDNEGQIIGVFAAARDISAIKKYEDELHDFENNLESIIQQKTAELLIANKELVFQNAEKDKRAEELIVANKELAFQNEEKEKRAAELVITLNVSYHDQLTMLYNRRFYEEELKRLDTMRNLPLTIVMGDVNGLKLINDFLGHAIGDELLKKTAEVITKGCRTDDIIARLGGDEFVILLPKTDSFETEQIIKRINELSLKEKVGNSEVSIAFGYKTKKNEDENIQEIFNQAEDQMYINKRSKIRE